MSEHSRSTSPLLILGAGAMLGFAGALFCRGAAKAQAKARTSMPTWVSEYKKQSDGTVHPDDLADGVGEDSFPASDPPSFSGNRSN